MVSITGCTMGESVNQKWKISKMVRRGGGVFVASFKRSTTHYAHLLHQDKRIRVDSHDEDLCLTGPRSKPQGGARAEISVTKCAGGDPAQVFVLQSW